MNNQGLLAFQIYYILQEGATMTISFKTILSIGAAAAAAIYIAKKYLKPKKLAAISEGSASGDVENDVVEFPVIGNDTIL